MTQKFGYTSLWLIFLLGVFPMGAIAQTITGKVTDKTDHGLIENVIIRNKNNNDIVYSNVKGAFQIKATKGDTILFFSQGYQPYSTTVKGENATKPLIIEMERKATTLHEVKIRPDWTPYQRDSIERYSTYQGTLEQEKATSIFNPFSLLADNISKKAKRRWRFQKNFAKWETQKFIDSRYSSEEVNKLTGLKGDSLAAFIGAYPMPYDYSRSASNLEIKLWIKNNYRQWIKNPYVPNLPELNFPDSSKTIPHK